MVFAALLGYPSGEPPRWYPRHTSGSDNVCCPHSHGLLLILQTALAIAVTFDLEASNLEGSIGRISGRLRDSHIDVFWSVLGGKNTIIDVYLEVEV